MNQPAGAMLALLVAMAFIVSGYIVITGRNIARYFKPLAQSKAITLMIGFALAAWVYKIIITLG